jgi:tyrosyl-tRNA synthetase
LLVEVGLATSKNEANRLIKQGGLSIDGEKVAPSMLEIQVEPGQERLIKVGKRRFARVKFE